MALYMAGQLAIALLLTHAISSSLQTLGLEHAAFNRLFKAADHMVALIVVRGNVAIILAIFLEIIRG